MQIATLIARRGGLDPALPEALRNALGGGDVTWLSPDTAAEFPLETRPGHRVELQLNCQAQGVDLVFQPTENRRKRLLIADMDSTMIQQECIDELAAEAGIGAGVAAITARAMNGELDFEAALTERVGLLAGQPEDADRQGRADEPDHLHARRRRASRDDEGAWRPCGAGLGRVHRLHRCRDRPSGL